MPDLLQNLYWRQPWWLLFVFYPLLLALWQQRVRHLSLRRYADPQLYIWVADNSRAAATGRRQQLTTILIWILLGITLAGPRTPLLIPSEAQPPQGSLIAVIDLSRSMDARDMRRSRREAAIDTLQMWSDSDHLPEIGLILFAGKSISTFPLAQTRSHSSALFLNSPI